MSENFVVIPNSTSIIWKNLIMFDANELQFISKNENTPLVTQALQNINSIGNNYQFKLIGNPQCPGARNFFICEPNVALFECIEYKNVFMILPVLIQLNTDHLNQTKQIKYQQYNENIGEIILYRLQNMYDSRLLKLFDFKIVMYFDSNYKYMANYICGPMEQTIFSIPIPTSWEYMMKVNQLIYNKEHPTSHVKSKVKKTKTAMQS